MPPSGATVGEKIGTFDAAWERLNVRVRGSDGVGGTMVEPSWPFSPVSGVDKVSPRLLGRLRGGFGGTINDGVGGAEKG